MFSYFGFCFSLIFALDIVFLNFYFFVLALRHFFYFYFFVPAREVLHYTFIFSRRFSFLVLLTPTGLCGLKKCFCQELELCSSEFAFS